MIDSGKCRQSAVDSQFRDIGRCLERKCKKLAWWCKDRQDTLKQRHIYGIRLNSIKASLAGAWLQALLKRNRQESLRVNEA